MVGSAENYEPVVVVSAARAVGVGRRVVMDLDGFLVAANNAAVPVAFQRRGAGFRPRVLDPVRIGAGRGAPAASPGRTVGPAPEAAKRVVREGEELAVGDHGGLCLTIQPQSGPKGSDLFSAGWNYPLGHGAGLRAVVPDTALVGLQAGSGEFGVGGAATIPFSRDVVVVRR
jgi:hypothetical protein